MSDRSSGNDMNERQLEEIAAQLGADAAQHLDVDRVAERVVAELRMRRTQRSWWRRTEVLLRVAAVVVALAVGGGGVYMSQLGSDDTVVAIAGPGGLEEFSTAELAEVLDSLDLVTPVYELVPASLNDLTEAQLRELLATMEG